MSHDPLSLRQVCGDLWAVEGLPWADPTSLPLVGGHGTLGREPRLDEPRFVDLNNEISNDVASRIDLAALHDRCVA